MVDARLVSKPFTSMRRLKVSALATTTSSVRVWRSIKVCNICPGKDCGGRSSNEMVRLPAKIARPGRTFSLMRIRIPAIDASKATDGLSISACLAYYQVGSVC